MPVRIPTRPPDHRLLACPCCQSPLTEDLTQCLGGGHGFPRTGDGPLTLWPDDRAAPVEDGWAVRQQLMEREYQDFVEDPGHVVRAYEHDFGGFREWLSTCQGELLDVGGGNGLLRHYLPAGARYTVLDPSLTWLGEDWGALSGTFPCLAEPLPFVRGFAEALPFRRHVFEWVLSFWSLNHVLAPERALEEMHRVLRPGGRALVVLDDMRPDLLAVWQRRYQDHRWTRGETLWRLAMSPMVGWPLKPDHVRVDEDTLERVSIGRFRLTRREWKGSYLALELESI